MTYCSPDDDRHDDYDYDFDARANEESLIESHEESFAAALDRDEVADGFRAFGPYVVEVFANEIVGSMNTIVLPSRVGWEPTF